MTTETRIDPAVLKLAGVLLVGVIAPLLDSTIVNIAIHTLGRELAVSVSTIQWVSTGYLLALAMAVPITGWAVERFGAKRMWLVALALFLAGSVLCGVAWNVGSLIGFRALQGAGGGLMLPIMQTMVLRASGGRRIGRLMAVITLPALIGPIFGPVIGGLILGHLDWRWIFFVNVPVCLAAILLALRYLPADAGRPGHRLDFLGLCLLSPALAALIYGLSEVGDQDGFRHAQVLLPIGAGALLLACFVARSLSAASPLLDLRLFGTRSFAASSALMFLSGLSLFGSMLLLPLYYQQLRGATVIAAGLLLAPQGVGSLLARGLGTLADRIGARPVVLLGFVTTALGTIPFAWADEHTSHWLLSGALIVRGVGLSGANLAVMVGAFRDLSPAQIPHASSVTRIVQQIGGSFGTAVLAVILQRQLADNSASTAFDHTFLWATGFVLLAIAPALLIPRARTSTAERSGAGRSLS